MQFLRPSLPTEYTNIPLSVSFSSLFPSTHIEPKDSINAALFFKTSWVHSILKYITESSEFFSYKFSHSVYIPFLLS